MMKRLALDVRPYHIVPVFRRKDQVRENANEGLGHGVGGDPFRVRSIPPVGWRSVAEALERKRPSGGGPWALPTAKLPAPFQGA